MQATAVERLPPDEANWSFEVKWDGVRAIVYVRGGRVRVQSRSLRDVTSEYPELARIADQVASDLVLDGELVALDEAGRPRFELLQQRINLRGGPYGDTRRAAVPVVFMAFDLLYADGRDITAHAYEDRRERLVAAAPVSEFVQVPRHHVGEGAALLEATRRNGVEGLVAKRLGSPYLVGQRSRSWLKVKNFRRQELVIGGWLPGAGGRGGRIGALVVGYYDGGSLRYAGRVGTGFTDAELSRLNGLLSGRAREDSPFGPEPELPAEVRRQARFVEPELVAEVAFVEWTRAGTLRAPSYKGLRDDIAPPDVRREEGA